jgi:hypothetical protein
MRNMPRLDRGTSVVARGFISEIAAKKRDLNCAFRTPSLEGYPMLLIDLVFFGLHPKLGPSGASARHQSCS